jgi:hypothetical protein
MAQITNRDVHVDQLLTNLSIQYRNKRYIADQVCPIVPVQKQSDIIPNFVQSHWFRDDAAPRAPLTKSSRGGYQVDNTNLYFCQRFSYGHEIADERRDNADLPYDLDRTGTNFATDKVMMKRERQCAANFFATTKWGTDLVGGSDFTQYSDYGASTPLVDFSADADTIEGKIAVEPNVHVYGKQVWTQLRWHPDVIDTIKYTQKGVMTEDLFAALIGIPKVLIGRAIFTSTAEGTAESSVTYSRIWGKSILEVYVPDVPSREEPSGCYNFTWQRVPNSIQYIRRMRDEERECDIIEANSYFDQRITGTNAGLFKSNAVA